jgi:hypothetical protein
MINGVIINHCTAAQTCSHQINVLHGWECVCWLLFLPQKKNYPRHLPVISIILSLSLCTTTYVVFIWEWYLPPWNFIFRKIQWPSLFRITEHFAPTNSELPWGDGVKRETLNISRKTSAGSVAETVKRTKCVSILWLETRTNGWEDLNLPRSALPRSIRAFGHFPDINTHH